MKKVFLLVALLIITNRLLAQRFDPCQVFGSFYIVDSPSRANLIVFEEESEAFAQLRIFEEENKLYADKTGLWFFTDQLSFADYRVYFTKKRSQAHFTIFRVERLAKAGCD